MIKTGRKAKELKVECRARNSFNYWLNRELRLACSSIEWDGMPDTVDNVWLENILNVNGSAIMFRDEIMNGWYVGANGSDGNIDWYGYPYHRMVIMRNGDTFKVSVDESVIIYNNGFREPDLPYFLYVADIMADYSSAIRVNVNSQKTMPILPTTREQALTIQNVYHDIENNIPYVLLDKNSLDIEALRNALLFDNRKSFTADLIASVKREEWNNFLTFIGIDNSNIDKKAQVNTLESGSNLEEILLMKRSRLNAREEGAKLIKAKWGLDVRPRYYGQERGDKLSGLYNEGTDDLSARVSQLQRESKP